MAPARTLPTSDTPPHWHSALELAASRGAAVQLTVIHGGRTVLNDSVRCTRDALGWLFSAGKPFTSLLVHRLAATGALQLDDPVARHWPEYGTGGAGTKAQTTIRDVLTHRTGLPTAGPYARAVLTMQDAESSARRVASARRRHRHFGQRPDGSPDGAASFSAVAAYQPLDFGILLGRVVQEVTGMSWAQAMRDLVLDPMSLADVHPGPGGVAAPVPARGRFLACTARRSGGGSDRESSLGSAGGTQPTQFGRWPGRLDSPGDPLGDLCPARRNRTLVSTGHHQHAARGGPQRLGRLPGLGGSRPGTGRRPDHGPGERERRRQNEC